MTIIGAVRPTFIPSIDGAEGSDTGGLARRVGQRVAQDQAARDNRQASVRISVSDETYVGVGAFGLPNTPQSLLNWAFAGVNANTLANGSGALGKLLGLKTPSPNDKDMTLRVYAEAGHPSLGDSDVFALSSVKAGMDRSGALQLRSGSGVVGIDLAREHGSVGFGPKKGFDTLTVGANVDFQKQTIEPVLGSSNGTASQPAVRGGEGQKLQTPAFKAAGSASVESTDPKHGAGLTRAAAAASPGLGMAMRAAVMGEAINNAIIQPKARLDAKGNPFVTTVSVRGVAVLGLPTPSGVVVGPSIDGSASMQFIEDGKNDIVIDNPFGADLKTTPQQIAAAAQRVIEPVVDTLDAGRRKLAGLFGHAGKEPGAAATAQVSSAPAAQVSSASTAQATASAPSLRFANGQDLSYAELRQNIAASRYSHAEQSTRDASAALEAMQARFPAQISTGERDQAFNHLWADYLTGATRSKVGEVSARAQQLGEGVRYSAAQAESLGRLSEGVRRHVDWQQKSGYAPMLPPEQVQLLQHWAQFVQGHVQR